MEQAAEKNTDDRIEEANSTRVPVDVTNLLISKLLFQDYEFTLPSPDIYTACLMALTFIGYIYQIATRRCSSSIKYNVSILAGCLVLAILFPTWEILVMPLQATIAFALLKYLRPDRRGVVAYFFCMVFQVSYVVFVYYRTYYLKISSPLVIPPLMAQTQKITLLVWNIHDGWRSSQSQKLTPTQEKCKLADVPPIKKFVSYVYNFHQLIFGPTIPFVEYQEFVESEAYQAEIQSAPVASALRYEILKKFSFGVLLLYLVTAIDQQIPLPVLYSPAFPRLNVFWRFVALWPIMFSNRSYFYYMWAFAESSNLAVGLGYSGKNSNGKPTWETCRSFNFWKVELAGSLKELKDNWNMRTQFWLRETVFERIENKFLAAMSVFFVVYIWHGVYAGYFLYAYTFGLITYAAREVRINLRRPIHSLSRFGPPIYNFVAVIVTQVFQTYLCASFFCLYFGPINHVWKHLYYYGHLSCFLVILVGVCYRKTQTLLRTPKKED